jgi:hypothetical protein
MWLLGILFSRPATPAGANNIWGDGNNLYVLSSSSSTIRKLGMSPPGSPLLTGISPSAALKLSLPATITLGLIGDNFVPGQTTVSVGGSGITVGAVRVANRTTLAVDVTITSDAVGDHRITVTTPAGTTGSVVFTVISK